MRGSGDGFPLFDEADHASEVHDGMRRGRVVLVAGCTEKSIPTTALIAAPASAPLNVETSRSPRHLVRDFTPDVPIAYFDLSLEFMKLTTVITPPVQARAYGYMGLALYESLVSGIPDHRSIAAQLNGIGPLPAATGMPYEWQLVANAALAEVMRGLWGDKTNRAAENVSELNALEARLASQYAAGVPPGLAKLSEEFGHAVGAAVFATSLDDGGNEAYLTNFPTSYVPPAVRVSGYRLLRVRSRCSHSGGRRSRL